MRLHCAQWIAAGIITYPAHQPLVIELHLREQNSDVDPQRGVGPRLVEFPALKRSVGSLEFIGSQLTPRTIVTVSHWAPRSFLSSGLINHRSSTRSSVSYSWFRCIDRSKPALRSCSLESPGRWRNL